MTRRFADMTDGYIELYAEVSSFGESRNPRGLPSREVRGVHFVLEDPTKPFPHGIGRKYGRAIAVAEALQLVAGTTDPQLMISVGSNFARFLDGGNLEGAYGPRIRSQLPIAVQRLAKDCDTRQALIHIWDPVRDGQVQVPKDLPCTSSLWFAIDGEDRLELHATMRSNDLWWGTAHDVPMFTFLQCTVANVLQIPVGEYHHHAMSLHIYERDLEAFHALRYDDERTPPPPWRGISAGTIEGAQERARDILSGGIPPMRSPTEIFCTDVIGPHVAEAERSRYELT
jgi:thymidylate synthase